MSDPSVEEAYSPSERVIHAIAEREQVDPTELDVPLFTSIDPEMLDNLVRSAADGASQSPLRIEFTYDGYDVVVSSDDTIHVSDGR